MQREAIGEQKRAGRVLLFLSVFLATYFIYADFNIGHWLGYAALCVLLVFYKDRKVVFTKTIAAYCFLVGTSVLFLCLPNAKRSWEAAGFVLTVPIPLLCLLFADYEEKWVGRALLVIQITSGVLVAALAFFRVFPGVYWSCIAPLLSEQTRSAAEHFMAKGYGVPMAGGYTYANYLFTLCVSSSLGQLVAGPAVDAGTRKRAAGFAIAAFFGILFTGRRSELIATAAAVCAVAFLYRKPRLAMKKHIRLSLLMTGILVGGILLFLMVKMGFLYRYVNTLRAILNSGWDWKEILGGDNDITSGRIELWEIATTQFWDSPVFGIGFFRFSDYVPDRFEDISGFMGNVHNDYLHHLCETGIVGTAMWLTPTVCLLVTAIKQARRIREKRLVLPPDVTVLNGISIGMQVFFMVLGLFDPCFYNLSHWSFYAFGVTCQELSERLEHALIPACPGEPEREAAVNT